jgi:pyrroline-5-carboxylate reductase
MSRIGFIGTGHIAAPMVRFLSQRGHAIAVSARNRDVAAQLKASHGVTVAPNQGVLDRSDVVFLCLRPHLAVDVLENLTFRADHKIISVMAGISMDQLSTLCAPASDICMTIPLGFLEQGGCPLPVFPQSPLLERLFAPENPVIATASEFALNQHFAVCVMLPGLLDLMETGAQWLGEKTGDAGGAAQYTTELVKGFLSALPPSSVAQLSSERDALATEGSLSLHMVQTLRDGNCHHVLRAAMDDIGAKLELDI